MHAGRLLVTTSLIAPGLAQLAIAGARVAPPKPTNDPGTSDHPAALVPGVSIRPDGTWILRWQLGVPSCTWPPGHSSTGMKSPFVKLTIVVVSVVVVHAGGVTLLQTMRPAASNPVT